MELTQRARAEREAFEQQYSQLHEAPINLDEIFDTFVRTIRDQYVGYEQKKKYFTPAEYHTYIYSHYRYHSLTLNMLVRSLHQMVGDLHDRHLRLSCDDWIDFENRAATYRVRAQGIYLYVTQADPDTGLTAGDKIWKVQSMTPVRIRKYTRNNCFYSREKERELWGGYLRMAESVEVEHEDGRREELRITPVPARERPERYENAFRMLEGETAYLKLEQLDGRQVGALMEAHREQIAGSRRLVIDLRRCIGGEEGAGWELFPYLVEEPKPLSELIADEGSYVLCTKQNCDIRLHQFSTYRDALTGETAADAAQMDQQLAILEEELAFYRSHYAQGLVYRPADPVQEEIIRPAARAPQQVVVLTDTFCENEGEQLAGMLKRCGKKVICVGRPTMGTLDYDDCIALQIGQHMRLSYPIRMSKAAYEGRGISEKGLPVDEYIPWSPEEIHRDVILERALQ